jgi:antitoxin (DNA-binding transcriptional repressor) of toxin-antitoxin stability system
LGSGYDCDLTIHSKMVIVCNSASPTPKPIPEAHFSELTHLVDAGQAVIIAKHGKPSYPLIRLGASPDHHNAAVTSKPKPTQTLLDRQNGLTTLRSKTTAPKQSAGGNFVAQWREESRYSMRRYL